MSQPGKSQQELYDLFITTLQNECPQLTDLLEGSIDDGLGGTYSIAAQELQRYITIAFNKTFFSLAGGPDETGGPDDLQTLAVDHFGASFSRPQAVAAVDVATFTRPVGSHNIYGAVLIPALTVVKTAVDANGNAQRYQTNADVTMTNSGSGAGISVAVGITAVVAGAAGNAAAGTITSIESSLNDPTIVVTNAGNATGVDAQDTPTYRQTILNLITTLRPAILGAIQAAALNVAGVVTANAIEIETAVTFFNVATQAPLRANDWFYIPFCTLYVADGSGTANGALIALVRAAVDPIRAYGIRINIVGATAISINWTAAISLNPSGPNFAKLSANTDLIVSSMKAYIAGLGPGVSFIKTTANAAMLAQWGPAGSNDLTSFSTTIPAADVSLTASQVAIPGTIATV